MLQMLKGPTFDRTVSQSPHPSPGPESRYPSVSRSIAPQSQSQSSQKESKCIVGMRNSRSRVWAAIFELGNWTIQLLLDRRPMIVSDVAPRCMADDTFVQVPASADADAMNKADNNVTFIVIIANGTRAVMAKLNAPRVEANVVFIHLRSDVIAVPYVYLISWICSSENSGIRTGLSPNYRFCSGTRT